MYGGKQKVGRVSGRDVSIRQNHGLDANKGDNMEQK